MFETVTYTDAAGKAVSASTTIGVGLPTVLWPGGCTYWAKFPKAQAAGWDRSGFFPVAVFFGKPRHAAQLLAAGVNTFMGAEHDGSTVASMTGVGMNLILQISEWTDAEIGSDGKVVGYFLEDEVEMNTPPSPFADNDTGRLQYLTSLSRTTRAKSDGRFLFANFGKGVFDSFWAPGTMPQYIAAVDVMSNDGYAYTSPAIDFEFTRASAWPSGKSPIIAGAYSWQVDQMNGFAGNVKPVWVFVETARPLLTETGSRTITPARIEGAAWAGIIHGALGVAFFQHNNDSTIPYYSIADEVTGPAPYTLGPIPTMTKKISADIAALAPVLNSPTSVWNFAAAGIDTMLKVGSTTAMIFAIPNATTGLKTFTLPSLITGPTVTVVGEGRTIPVAGGKFTDTFAAEYTHHIYKVSL